MPDKYSGVGSVFVRARTDRVLNDLSRPTDARESDEDTFVFSQLAERLVDGLLMVDEPPLSDQISGASSFTERFQTRGPADPQGRSLRQFDLRPRLFNYRCSYLIYSDSFDAIPDPVRVRALKRPGTIVFSLRGIFPVKKR